jgi:cathepsin O
MAPWTTYLQVFFCVALLFFMIPIKIDGPDEVELQFLDYLEKFHKTYDGDMYQSKLQAFKKSLDNINALNSNKTGDSAVYGLTKFSDMLPEEFLNKHLHLNLSQRFIPHSNKHHHHHPDKRSTLPQKIDWREKKVVTKVHNQGNCGACWAYSVVETIESMYGIKTQTTEDLSVQEIIDCAGNNNDGCNGGDVCSLLSWMTITNFTIHKKSDYGKNSRCGKVSAQGVQLQDFVCDRLVGSENAMMKLLVNIGPLAVAVNAQTWQNYIGGVIEYHCDGDVSSLNHAVQIVGYDLTAKIPHYIVRNTWGEDWGDRGYLYIAVDKNMCGVANEVSALKVL